MKLRFIGGPLDNQEAYVDPGCREWVVPVRDDRDLIPSFQSDSEAPPIDYKTPRCYYVPARIYGAVVMVHACGARCEWREIESARKEREASSTKALSSVALQLLLTRLQRGITPPGNPSGVGES